MALRIRIPFLLDVLLVRDPEEIRALNDDPRVGRPVVPEGGWIHRRLARRIDPDLRFDGKLLPVFRKRGQRDAAADRLRYEARARAQRSRNAAQIRTLARYVAGHPIERPVGVVAQELLGSLFRADYRSTPQLWADARAVRAWLRPLGGLRPGSRRRLRGARRRLLAAAGRDLDGVHATAIGVHGFVESLERMRRLVRNDRARSRLDDEAAAVRCIHAPGVLLRSAETAFTPSFRRAPLRRGTLIALRLRAAQRRFPASTSPFAQDAWNECPALSVVPELLERVWEMRRREAPLLAHRASGAERAAAWISDHLLDRFPWHTLPGHLGVVKLVGTRTWMRAERLLDSEGTPPLRDRAPTAHELAYRTPDGRFNDLDDPGMGAAGRRFGRNLPRSLPPGPAPSLLEPNPREISLALMTRHRFQPIPTLNLLAAAWIQFMAHDWFNHDRDRSQAIEVPPAPDDPHFAAPMRVPRTRPAPRAVWEDPDRPLFANTETHWWDASQLYGSSRDIEAAVRSGRDGKLRLVDGRLPRWDDDGTEISGFTENWWLGLSLLHTLFAREHNAVCDALKRHYPSWSDAALFGHARLVVAALLAKIHTLEWTPAILDHPALHITMKATWWGFLGEAFQRRFGRVGPGDLLGGIPGSARDHFSAPYALTEEFVAVYRMHQLLPDDLVYHSLETGRSLGSADLAGLIGIQAQREVDWIGMQDALYSFGIAHPGALTLHNYPRLLQHLERDGEETIDLAAVDILRDRERGLPRYNRFRELLDMPRFHSFEELCGSPETAKALAAVYGDDIDAVDLQVGMAAERRPAGFGFSETAFRIFIVMAARRLKSDRFFTTDFDEDTYSPVGLAWVRDNSFDSVLRRHFPALGAALRGIGNPFFPWRRTPPAGGPPGA